MKRRSSEKRTTEDNDDKGEKIWATNKWIGRKMDKEDSRLQGRVNELCRLLRADKP